MAEKQKLTVFVDASYFVKAMLNFKELDELMDLAERAKYSLQFCTTDILKSETIKNIIKILLKKEELSENFSKDITNDLSKRISRHLTN